MTIEPYSAAQSYSNTQYLQRSDSVVDTKLMQQLNLQTNFPSLSDKRIVLIPRPDIGRVIIKIVEKNTDKVIKELPPVALQHVYRHIRSLLKKPI